MGTQSSGPRCEVASSSTQSSSYQVRSANRSVVFFFLTICFPLDLGPSENVTKSVTNVSQTMTEEQSIDRLLINQPKQFSYPACAFAGSLSCECILAPIPFSILEKGLNGFTAVGGFYGLSGRFFF